MHILLIVLSQHLRVAQFNQNFRNSHLKFLMTFQTWLKTKPAITVCCCCCCLFACLLQLFVCCICKRHLGVANKMQTANRVTQNFLLPKVRLAIECEIPHTPRVTHVSRCACACVCLAKRSSHFRLSSQPKPSN